jgi:putative SOS response-associated peptidase YedK
MCGRFAITLPNDAMARLFAAKPANALPDVPNHNVCPTNAVHVVHRGEVGRQLGAMRWGFLPHWYKTGNDGPLLINARAETLAQKPAFRAACRDRRCLIVASGFYEWSGSPDGQRLPWYIRRRDGAPMAFGGIWQDWGTEPRHRSCAIVTTASNPHLSAIHHRMPLMIAPPDWPLWLGEAGKGAARLMRPAGGKILAYFRVGTGVNSNRASGAGLIEPLMA